GQGERGQEAARDGQRHVLGGFCLDRDLRDRAQDHIRLIGVTLDTKARRNAAGPFASPAPRVSASIPPATRSPAPPPESGPSPSSGASACSPADRPRSAPSPREARATSP